MIIREGRESDAKSCLNLQKQDKESYWKGTDFEKSAGDKDVVFLVAEDGEKIAGYVLGFIVPTKRTEALVHETKVDKGKRGKGIGTRLVNAFCKEISKKGAKVVYAEIEPGLLRFYRGACKFEESGGWVEVRKQL